MQPCGSQRSSVLKILDIHALDLLFKEGARACAVFGKEGLYHSAVSRGFCSPSSTYIYIEYCMYIYIYINITININRNINITININYIYI